MKNIMICLLASLLQGAAFAQQNEEKIFSAICINIYNNNMHLKIRSDLGDNFTIVVDPITGDEFPIYADSSAPAVAHFLSKYDSFEQSQIIFADTWPIYPLRDTLYIVDPNNIFKNTFDYSVKQDDFDTKYFKIVTDQSYEGKPALIFNKKTISNSGIIYSFTIPGDDKNLYSFKYLSDNGKNIKFECFMSGNGDF